MLNLTLTGDKKLVDQLEQYPTIAASVIGVKVASLTLKLQAHITQDKLTGQVLGVKTGALRRSIANEYSSDSLSFRGRIFSSGDVKYAAFWEFGFNGTERVKAFERLVKAEGLRRGFKVREHTRQVNQAPRSFMRSALADMAAEITTEIKKAAVASVAQACGKSA